MTRTRYIPALLLSLALAAPVWAQSSGQGSTAPRNAPPLYVPRPNDRDVNGGRPMVSNGAQQHAEAPRNGDWLRHTMQLPPREQERALEQDSYFRSLPPKQQERFRAQLRAFNQMSPSQRQRVLARMEMMDHMDQGQQQQREHCDPPAHELPSEGLGWPQVSEYHEQPEEEQRAVDRCDHQVIELDGATRDEVGNQADGDFREDENLRREAPVERPARENVLRELEQHSVVAGSQFEGDRPVGPTRIARANQEYDNGDQRDAERRQRDPQQPAHPHASLRIDARAVEAVAGDDELLARRDVVAHQ